jgi:hypothetical protein
VPALTGFDGCIAEGKNHPYSHQHSENKLAISHRSAGPVANRKKHNRAEHLTTRSASRKLAGRDNSTRASAALDSGYHLLNLVFAISCVDARI